jgi:hypothetical protein
MWNPMAAILNFFIMSFTSSQMGNIMTNQGLTAASSPIMLSDAAAYGAMAGYLYTSVPALSYFLLSGSGNMLGNFSQGLAGKLDKNLSSDSVNKDAQAISSSKESGLGVAETKREQARIAGMLEGTTLATQRALGDHTIASSQMYNAMSQGAGGAAIIEQTAKAGKTLQEGLKADAIGKVVTQVSTSSGADSVGGEKGLYANADSMGAVKARTEMTEIAAKGGKQGIIATATGLAAGKSADDLAKLDFYKKEGIVKDDGKGGFELGEGAKKYMDTQSTKQSGDYHQQIAELSTYKNKEEYIKAKEAMGGDAGFKAKELTNKLHDLGMYKKDGSFDQEKMNKMAAATGAAADADVLKIVKTAQKQGFVDEKTGQFNEKAAERVADAKSAKEAGDTDRLIKNIEALGGEGNYRAVAKALGIDDAGTQEATKQKLTGLGIYKNGKLDKKNFAKIAKTLGKSQTNEVNKKVGEVEKTDEIAKAAKMSTAAFQKALGGMGVENTYESTRSANKALHEGMRLNNVKTIGEYADKTGIDKSSQAYKSLQVYDYIKERSGGNEAQMKKSWSLMAQDQQSMNLEAVNNKVNLAKQLQKDNPSLFVDKAGKQIKTDIGRLDAMNNFTRQNAEYTMVNNQTGKIETYQRSDNGTWHEYRNENMMKIDADQTAKATSVGIVLEGMRHSFETMNTSAAAADKVKSAFEQVKAAVQVLNPSAALKVETERAIGKPPSSKN